MISIIKSTCFCFLVAVCGIVARYRRVFRSIDGDRSPAGALIYSNNFLALSAGEIPCMSSSCPFNDSYEAGVGPEMLGHTNLNRSFGRA